MKHNIYKIYVTTITAIVLLLTGCTMEEQILPPSSIASGEVSFELNIPGHKIPHISRSGMYDENSVETLDVLLFEPDGQRAGKFKRRQKVTGFTNDTNGTISVKLKFIPEEAGWEVVFVANASDIISSINENDTKLTALEKLTVAQENKWEIQHTPIPMYGEIVLKESDIQYGYKIEGINLIHMLARIDVKVAPEVYNFTLVEVYLANRSTQGYISSQWDYKGTVNKGKVTEPNWSPYFSFANNQEMSNASLESDDNIRYEADMDHNNCVGQIYTFESEAKAYDSESTTATCLIIKGYMDNDPNQLYYYRVDFTDSNGEFMSVLRNHQYVFEITAVNGIGYATIKEALEAYTVVSNMHIRAIVWDNEMLSDIHYNGQYMLGIQLEEMIFSSKGDILENFIATDYEKGITIVEKPDWVTVTNFTDGQTEAFIEIKVDANPLSAIREGDIRLQAGRVTHAIKVNQNKKSDRSNSVVKIASVPGIGFLGNDNGGGTNASLAMRKVLDTHFKMGGTVELKEILYYTISNNGMVTADYLNDKDIVFLTYGAVPTQKTMELIISWLQASPKRVLIISYDSSGTNPEAFKLDYFKQDIPSIQWSHGSKYEDYLVHTPGAEYFWKDGPFTKGERIESATYLNSDGIFGAATLSASSKILPIFQSETGAMVFGVDPLKRIVYIGDSQYGEPQTGSSYLGRRFNNTQGRIENDVEKILANIWAWVIDEVVLKDE